MADLNLHLLNVVDQEIHIICAQLIYLQSYCDAEMSRWSAISNIHAMNSWDCFRENRVSVLSVIRFFPNQVQVTIMANLGVCLKPVWYN